MAEMLERAGDGVPAPALRIAFDGVIEGAQEAGEQVLGGQKRYHPVSSSPIRPGLRYSSSR
jgi:hypothetical protein